MAVTSSIITLDNGLSYIDHRYSGNVVTADITKSLVENVIKTATDQFNCIISNWSEVTNAEFSIEDILAAAQGAFSVDLVSRKMYLAFILNGNPHLEYLANFFAGSVDKERIQIKIVADEAEATEWFSKENIPA